MLSICMRAVDGKSDFQGRTNASGGYRFTLPMVKSNRNLILTMLDHCSLLAGSLDAEVLLLGNLGKALFNGLLQRRAPVRLVVDVGVGIDQKLDLATSMWPLKADMCCGVCLLLFC